MTYYIKLAEKVIEIRSLYDRVQKMCKGYILEDDTVKKPDLVVKITQDDIDREEAAAKEENQKTGEIFNLTPAQLETTAVYRKIASSLIDYNIFLMHGSVISTAGKGYMITAPSGTGKTTRTKLWIDNIPNSIVVNGDKPLLKVTDNTVYAFGTPWSGKEGWNMNTCTTLQAILMLERSDNGNTIREMPFAEAFPKLLQQVFLPTSPEAKQKTLQLMKELAAQVRIYHFHSEPTKEAVRKAWETIN